MRTFEFVSVLLSLVVSLALAHLLTAVARMLVAKEMKFSFVLAGWIAVAFFTCIDIWFSLWHAREAPEWSLGYVMLWLLAATFIYLFAWVVVPEGKLDGVDLRAYHNEHRRKYLPLYAGYVVVGVAINATVAAFQDLISWQVVIWFAPIVVAWIWPNRWVQLGALTAQWLMIADYASTFLGTF